MVDYQSMRDTCTAIKQIQKIIKYKKKEKLSWKMALPPDESLTSKDGTVLIWVQCIADTCVQSHCT